MTQLLTSEEMQIHTPDTLWTDRSGVTSFVASSAQAHSGGQSGLVTWSGGAGPWVALTRRIPVLNAARKYQVAFWIYRGTYTGNFTVKLTCRDVGGSILSTLTSSSIASAAGVWVPMVMDPTALPANTVTVQPGLFPASTPTAAQTTYIDDAVVSEVQPPWRLQKNAAAAGASAAMTRRALGSRVQSPGIVDTNDLYVSKKGTGPNLSVDVSEGSAYIKDASADRLYGARFDYGMYYVESQGTTNVVIAPPDATYTRIDGIDLVVHDTEVAGNEDAWAIEATPGTPASSPTAPAVPTNALRLATVTVTTKVKAIFNHDINNVADVTVARGPSLYTLDGSRKYFQSGTGPWVFTDWYGYATIPFGKPFPNRCTGIVVMDTLAAFAPGQPRNGKFYVWPVSGQSRSQFKVKTHIDDPSYWYGAGPYKNSALSLRWVAFGE